MKQRCAWASKEIFYDYHDKEWGVPVHDDNKHFEFIVLEGAQAGLSWETILKKRENYRIAFDNFDPKIISKYDDEKVQELLANEGIVRNKLKVASAIINAKVFLSIQKEFGSFDKYIWDFTDGKVINNVIKSISDIPAKTELSDRVSKDLIKRGMKFVGSTIIYAHLQAIGIVNDHEEKCFCKM